MAYREGIFYIKVSSDVDSYIFFRDYISAYNYVCRTFKHFTQEQIINSIFEMSEEHGNGVYVINEEQKLWKEKNF